MDNLPSQTAPARPDKTEMVVEGVINVTQLLVYIALGMVIGAAVSEREAEVLERMPTTEVALWLFLALTALNMGMMLWDCFRPRKQTQR